ncbi:DUF1028 domain-containing protein [Pseudomonas mediterranea]|jgi:uncharacterized Ntn-hydrolase superfamily protein|uniref:Uncharacterized conserved protein, Ntn-hydrolase superfamily n=1 Tax=Pseudomonas mediterranea TaxID=183795 RepID=A0AAX2DCU1_9PSED|nr:DUF1028 domain-containing protein [Pseudomonas mediterranea]KGU83039.1 major pilin protein fimA [Pseudomonas mediterranea CFBP 5447]MBL0841830.1 DUF1028 domain-containing protein [Pseudomonas mediterranea]MDU9029510.1 DUF1028 domain-containing protein [Pseudomonas mediterranea]QHA83000.1 DUF1028 domain-containing protein [Pseudomonas mediterranea]UZD98823.1 DUF1028 domain-containing protein [Pseudomonas mediterranea]
MTFSIVGRCAETGQLGVAISSSSIAVGARCPWLRAGVGAVSSQNITLPALGPLILDELADGLDAREAVDRALARNGYSEYRQVAVVDAHGHTAIYSGCHALGVHNSLAGEQCVAAGNLLADEGVIDAMIAAFEGSEGCLAARLMNALRAGQEAGGEAGAVHSAALSVVDDLTWPIVDLRVDWAEQNPIGELEKLWVAYQPQLQDYLIRALNPTLAPRYGVPGDE